MGLIKLTPEEKAFLAENRRIKRMAKRNNRASMTNINREFKAAIRDKSRFNRKNRM